MPHIAITGQDISARALFRRVQYLVVNPGYSFEGLTGDAGLSMVPDSLIPHLQHEIQTPLVTDNPVVQFLLHSPTP